MRYYDLQIIDPATKQKEDTSPEALLHFSTHRSFPALSGNLYDPGYLNIEFDVTHTEDSFSLNSSITIHGIDLETVKFAKNYKGKRLYLRAGWRKGCL